MPEDRFLHPRLRSSRKVGALTWLERCVWEDMILGADDYGVLPCKAAKIRADNDAMMRESEDAIALAMKTVVSIGLFIEFEHQGQAYVCDPLWQEFQKVTYPRRTYYPVPPIEVFPKLSEETHRLFLKHHKGIPEKSLPVLREGLRLKAKGKRLSAEAHGNGSAPAPESAFEAFYAAYPRKVAPGAARRAWRGAVAKATPEVIMEGLTRALPDLLSREKRFMPYPASWLNQERWNDEPTPPDTPKPPKSGAGGDLEGLRRFANKGRKA